MSGPHATTPPSDALVALEESVTDFFRVFELPAVRAFVARQSPPGLDLRHLRVLRAVESLGQPAVGELAEVLDLDLSTVSRLVDKAIAAGLVVRERDAKDGRRRVLSLTPAGEADLAAGWELRLRLWQALADGLPDRDIAATVRVFEHVRRRAESLAAAVPEAGPDRT